ncbi:KN motif and ankyrin repeat domain-containing protein 1-like [Pseudophryne corroboree]|uniref:KN motif and ankyrin repeat domain-containing protein 1-like n=1 Tax=Pseudophryne corroboree TaxID=495146 RepID=UPI003081BEDF
MTQSVNNLPDLGGPFLYWEQNENEKTSYCVETPYGFQLDLDFLKYVDDIQSGQTLKKVTGNRKPRVPRRSTSSLRSLSSQTGTWLSTESLDFSEDGTSDSVFYDVKTETSSSGPKETLGVRKSNPLSPAPIIKLLPPPSSKSHLKNSRVEKTLAETRKRLEQEQLNLYYEEVQGRTCQPSNLSKLSAASRSSPNLTQTSLTVHHNKSGERRAMLNEGFSGSVKISPVNSGRSTPATNTTSTHLHYIREQMAASLKQLKDLEEQVKVIPLLQMRISKLDKEKKQLMVDMEKQKTSFGKDLTTVNDSRLNDSDSKKSLDSISEQDHGLESIASKPSKIAELKRLTEKLSDTDKSTGTNKMVTEKSLARHQLVNKNSHKSIAVGDDFSMEDAVFYYRSQQENKEVAVQCTTETQHVGVWVMESLLGLTCEADKEIQLLQHTIEHQKAVISMLEDHVKAAADELEELRLAVFSRQFVDVGDKENELQPQTLDSSPETYVPMFRKSPEEYLKADTAITYSSDIPSTGITCVTETHTVGVMSDMMVVYEGENTQENNEAESSCCENAVETESQPEVMNVATNKEHVKNIVDMCDESMAKNKVHEEKVALCSSTEVSYTQSTDIQSPCRVAEDSIDEKNEVTKGSKNLENVERCSFH